MNVLVQFNENPSTLFLLINCISCAVSPVAASPCYTSTLGDSVEKGHGAQPEAYPPGTGTVCAGRQTYKTSLKTSVE